MNRTSEHNKQIMNKILLITYHFPPSIAVGGLRLSYFAKYLPAFGWEPTVLTINQKYLTRTDKQREQDIARVKVIRTAVFPSLIDLYLTLKRIVLSVQNGKRVSIEELETAYIQQNSTPSQAENSVQKIKRYVVSILALPDLERNWVIVAALRAIREVRTQNIDCILTSSPPYSVQLIGLLVKLVTGVKWLVDFRDPWMIAGPKRLYVHSPLSVGIEKWMERQVIRKADLVLSTTEMLSKAFQDFYKNEAQNKFIVLSNGFDFNNVLRLSTAQKYEKFTLSYTGTLYLGRSPEPVFEAIQELSSEGRINLSDICVKLVGDCRHIEGRPIAGLVNKYGLNGVVEVIDSVPYLDSLDIIKKSHVALLFAPNQPYQIPAKAFDYIGLGTEILALTEEGATRDLVLSTGTGAAVESTDVHGIKEFIYHSMRNRKGALTEQSSEKLRAFDRRQIAGRLADFLNGIT